MKYIRELFGEKGDLSCVRVMSFMTCCTGLYLALTHGDVSTIGVLLGTAFGGKVAQRFAEKSS